MNCNYFNRNSYQERLITSLSNRKLVGCMGLLSMLRHGVSFPSRGELDGEPVCICQFIPAVLLLLHYEERSVVLVPKPFKLVDCKSSGAERWRRERARAGGERERRGARCRRNQLYIYACLIIQRIQRISHTNFSLSPLSLSLSLCLSLSLRSSLLSSRLSHPSPTLSISRTYLSSGTNALKRGGW